MPDPANALDDAKALQRAVIDQHQARLALMSAASDVQIAATAARYLDATDAAYEIACEIKGHTP